MVKGIATFGHDLKSAARSLTRTKGLSAAVIVTLALGIGANAAMFTLVRGVLLRPLVNRDEARLIYIRQRADGGNELFSMPEIADLSSRMKTMNSFGDFSVMDFTMVGLGEPRTVQGGVVGGSFFQTMGLRPVLGRLLDEHDDGPKAAPAMVLTYRFWSTALHSDPSVLGKSVRLGTFIDTRTATVVGVLEPCVPYPQDTQIIANVVTSAHHLSATMVTDRLHRMTDVFARLAPGADLETARAELESVYGAMKREHPEAYKFAKEYRVSAVRLRDELTSGARTILLVLMAASVLVFLIACSNVANLILARSVRRENELAIRAALGAGTGDLRRTLLAESLVLCVAGAGIGVLIAKPLVAVLARYASRYSVRALDLTLDSSMLWVAGGLAVAAAMLLAFVPRLPSWSGALGLGLTNRSARSTAATNRRLKIFALIQIAASFVLVTASAGAMKTLLSLEMVQTGFDMRHVLAVNVPVVRDGKTPAQVGEYYREAMRRIHELPGVVNVSAGRAIPWRGSDTVFPVQFAVDGHVPAEGEESQHAIYQVISPAYFATLGLPVLEGRDFNEGDRDGAEPVAIVSESVARQMFPDGHAVNHYTLWTDPLLRFAPVKPVRRRIVGIVPDIDNSHLEPRPTMTIYQPADQDRLMMGDRLIVQVRSDPYAMAQPITRILRQLSPNQPVEGAATLADIRAEVMSPERLNVAVSVVFAGVALLIAVVGVAGVLAFTVSGRTREFGIRLAVGSQPRNLLLRVVAEGAAMAIGGLALGVGCGYWLAQLAGGLLGELKMPGVLPVAGSALVLLMAAVTASAIPAVRAARIDVIQALRSE